MDAIDADGLFWLPGRPEQSVAGRLRFSTASGASLDLIGAFGGLASLLEPPSEAIRILGLADKKLLTLDGCRQAGSTVEMPGIQRERYLVSQVLVGAHWGLGDPVLFDSIKVSFDHLPNWVCRGALDLSMEAEEKDGGGQRFTKIAATLTPLDDETISVGDLSLTLGFTFSWGGDRLNDFNFGQSCFFQLMYPEPRPLDDLLTDVSAIRHLVTLAADVPAAVTYLSGSTPELTFPPGTGRRQWVDVLQQQVVLPQEVAKNWLDMLFLFEQLGGLATVGRWLSLAKRRESALGSLLSIRYNEKTSVENRLQNVALAAETLDRSRTPDALRPADEFKSMRRKILRAVPKEYRGWLSDELRYSNERRLRHRLATLAEFAGEPFEWLVADTAQWVTVVTEARNRLTHQDEEQPFHPEPADLYWLSESVYVLVLLCLFRECSVEDAVLDKAKENRRIAFLGQRMQEVVPRLFEQVARNRASWETKVAAELAAEEPEKPGETSR